MKYLVSALCIHLMLSLLVRSSSAQQGPASESMHRAVIREKIASSFLPPAWYKDQYGHYRSPLRFYNGDTVLTPHDWALRRMEIRQRWMKMMGEWPPLLKDQRLEILDSSRRDNFTQYRVRFYWTPNQQTIGYLLIPEGRGKKPAVITVYYEPETAIGKGKPDRDFAYQLARRGFVTLSLGTTETTKAKTYALYYPDIHDARVEPLSMLGCAAANAWYALSKVPQVDSTRIGIMGHSYGGKWAMFASCLFDKFACAVWSDPGIVFDETKGSYVNYWEPWYLGYYPWPWKNAWRKKGMIPGAKGLYPELITAGYDLHELHVLMAPRPFLVSGGYADQIDRWVPLNWSVAVNRLLGYRDRVAMTNRKYHAPTPRSNEKAYLFFEYFLKYNGLRQKPR